LGPAAQSDPDGHLDQIYGPNGLGEVYYNGNKQELRILRENGIWQTLAISHADMYKIQIAAFARWILTDEPFPTTGEDGKAALRVALAALKSIQTGQTINL
jgi:predicted dehydrogenase